MARGDRRSVAFDTAGGSLRGSLRVPPEATSLVVIGSEDPGGRHARPETALIEGLTSAGIATFAVDLRTPGESADDTGSGIDHLCGRLETFEHWLSGREDTAVLDVAYYGVSAGAAATLRAVAGDSLDPTAVVARNGRLDLVPSTPQDGTPVLYVFDDSRGVKGGENLDLAARRASERDSHALLVADTRALAISRTVEWLERQFAAGPRTGSFSQSERGHSRSGGRPIHTEPERSHEDA